MTDETRADRRDEASDRAPAPPGTGLPHSTDLPMPLSAAVGELYRRLGPTAVLSPDVDPRTGASRLAAYESPYRGPAGQALFVARPADLDEVRTVVLWALRHDVALLPQGARTGLVGAGTPAPGRPQGVLSTERLVGPLTIDPEERSVTAGAGARLSAVTEAAAEHGLQPAVDLSADPTLGGLVATNAGGCRVMRHGDVRRQVLGLQAVLAVPGAPVVGDLRPLRKDNTGLRGADLFIGSGGQLGVITAVTLELVPMATERVCALLLLQPEASLSRLVGALERRYTPLVSAVELISASARGLVAVAGAARDPFPRSPGDDVLLVELSGPHAEQLLTEAVEGLLDGPDVRDGVLVPTSAAWTFRHAVSESLARAGDVLGLDVSVPRSALTAVRVEAARLVAERWPTARLADFGHIADGGLHLNVVVPPDLPPADRTALREGVYEIVDRHAGSWSAEHGLGPVTLDHWRRHAGAGERELSALLKSALDPRRVLGSAAVRDALAP